MPEKLFKVNKEEYILPGNRACQGCGLSLAYRYILKALRENTILTLPASCLTVLHGLYPITSVGIPCLNCTFASTAASASGLVAGLTAMNRSDITVVAIAGDGGTFDIGIQALSGAAERGTDFIFVCYDNEGYMNTGTQRSSATPVGALTTTTPVLTKQQNKKDMMKIMEGHDIPYLATCSPSFPIDLYDKFVKAKTDQGNPLPPDRDPLSPRLGLPAEGHGQDRPARRGDGDRRSLRDRKREVPLHRPEQDPGRKGDPRPGDQFRGAAGAVQEDEHGAVGPAPAVGRRQVERIPQTGGGLIEGEWERISAFYDVVKRPARRAGRSGKF